MNISEKKTVLDDSASIYTQRETKSEKEHWAELKTKKEKWDYFRMYIMKKVWIGIGALIVLAYVVYLFLRPQKDTRLFVAYLDNVMADAEAKNIQQKFGERIDLNKEKEELRYDVTFNITSNPTSATAFTTHVYAKEVDIIIAPESCFRNMAANICLPVEEFLPKELLDGQEDRYVIAVQRDIDGTPITETEKAYGLAVTDKLIYNPYITERIVVGVPANSQHKEDALKFIEQLLSGAYKTNQ